jgi:hypothetical protein
VTTYDRMDNKWETTWDTNEVIKSKNQNVKE